jgi:hypothetical protein
MKKFSPEYFALHVQDGEWHEADNVPGADPGSYRPLNHCWFVDSKYVYLKGRPLRHADVASFTALNELFAKDRHRVYCMNREACVHDPAGFMTLDDGYYVDSLQGPVYAGYARDAQAVYFAQYPEVAHRIILGADRASFVSLGRAYGKDARHAYRAGKLLEGAEPDRFEVLGEGYARDAANVWYDGRRLEGAVARDFEVLKDDRARDSAQVYHYGHVVPEADPRSYRWFDDLVACDAQRVYVRNEIQPNIDAASFEYLGHNYFADKNNVYWQGSPIAGADRASFRALSSRPARAKDRNTTYKGDEADSRRGQRRRDTEEEDFSNFTLPQSSDAGEPAPEQTAEYVDGNVTAAPERKFDVAMLAKTLAAGDEEALAIVELAMRDPKKFLKTYREHEQFADEPDYDELLGDVDGPKDLDPLQVMVTVYWARRRLGIIDWRSDVEETIWEVEPMLWRLGVRDFDWRFIDVLAERGDGSELKNANFLSLLRDRLRSRGLALVHIYLFNDNYNFAILPSQEFAKINGMDDPEENWRISDNFDADASYERGQGMLKEAGLQA